MDMKSTGNYSVKLARIIEKFELVNQTPLVNIDRIQIRQSDINRPALQFAGFFDHFDNQRIQLVGKVECEYLRSHDEEYMERMVFQDLLGDQRDRHRDVRQRDPLCRDGFYP